MPLASGSNSFQLNAIKANSPADVWAVGEGGFGNGTTGTLIEHFKRDGVEHRAEPVAR